MFAGGGGGGGEGFEGLFWSLYFTSLFSIFQEVVCPIPT